MIDLHCHYLPGIDDGAKTMEEALNLARASVNNGIQCAIMTPHLHPGRYENIKASIATSTQAFRNALKKARIPLQIGYAAEVRLAPETLPLIESGQVPFLGEVEGYQLMLLEFPHSHIPLGADKLVDRLLDNKIRPIIAHPERNKDVMRDLDKITPFREMGCLLQLTAASIVNRFGDNAHTRAVELLESDAALIIATDAHNLKSRPPILREAMEAAANIIGHQAAHDMVYRVPKAIVASQFAKGQDTTEKPAPDTTPTAQRKQHGRVRPAQPTVRAASKTASAPHVRTAIEQQLASSLPAAIDQVLKNTLIPELTQNLKTAVRDTVDENLKADLAERVQRILTVEYRNKLATDIINDARQAAYLEVKEQFKNELQQEIMNKLQEEPDEQPSRSQQVNEVIGLPGTNASTQAKHTSLASSVKNRRQ